MILASKHFVGTRVAFNRSSAGYSPPRQCVSGCESDTWHALTAPPKTPDGVVAKLNDAANKAMKDPELLERYRALSITPGGGSPADAGAFLKAETKRWGDVIRAAGIQPQ